MGVPSSVSTTASAEAPALPRVTFATVTPTTSEKTANRTAFCHVTHANVSTPDELGIVSTTGYSGGKRVTGDPTTPNG